MSKQQIESILLNKPTIVDQKIVNAVIEKAREWYHQIIASFVQFGCNFQDYPVIFMGGGSLLFKQFIEERYIINVYEIIDDPFSNAIAYKRLISKENKEYDLCLKLETGTCTSIWMIRIRKHALIFEITEEIFFPICIRSGMCLS